MDAITIEPGRSNSVRLEPVPEPGPEQGPIVVESIATGVCGTDAEIVAGEYGEAPEGEGRLVLGHESLGRVVDPGPYGGFEVGDLVVGVVRRPDPVPCRSCAVGESDMCRNGRFTERGIKGRHGFMAERWGIEPEHAVRVSPALGALGVLMEPASVVAKAWEQVDRVGDRAFWEPRTVLVTGTGPIGLLAALIGCQRGLDVVVLGRHDTGPKADLVTGLGARLVFDIDELDDDPDVVVEATGAGTVIAGALDRVAPGGVVCLTGLGGDGHRPRSTLAELATQLVLDNTVVVGSVNANRRHFVKAHDVLCAADQDWLAGLITRRMSPTEAVDALREGGDDVKAVVDWT
ncbi:glucose 1-dehydrogenase [Rhabdothermincola salaria]|uniref:glucose 1-dehydrogenase n=1 Tax=Rhabdothermincola salaria TaxID=2903142 RepID=UPI001E341F82|nr:glucose 1-dehydrogenase [Rhabdothermincola salaria]MCD9622709.1 glucose 1-dehydrogenase [Rhabdothermincola salaria]